MKDLSEEVERLAWQVVESERRLRRLERQNAWLKLGAFLTLGLASACAWVLYPAFEASWRDARFVLSAEDGGERHLLLTALAGDAASSSLRLRDSGRRYAVQLSQSPKGPKVSVEETYENGRRADLELGAAGPALVLTDPKNGWQFECVVEPAGPVLSFAGRAEEQWRRRVAMGLNDKGPYLRFLDEKGDVIGEFPGREKSVGDVAAEAVTARAFRLVDEKGKLRAELALKRNEPVLTFFRANGNKGAELGVVDASAALRLFDEKQSPRAELALAREGFGAELSLFDDRSKVRTRLGVETEGTSTLLNFWDEQGRLRSGLGVQHEGSFVGLSGLDGKPRAVLAVMGYQPGLSLFSKDEKRMLSIGVEDGGAAIALSDANGNPRAIFGVAPDGSGSSVSFLSPEPKLRAVLGVNGSSPVFRLVQEDPAAPAGR